MANSPAELLQAEYLDRLRVILRRVPVDIREDVVNEVRSHIDDEWQALGGDLNALQVVLQRLGPPEEYGRDLALQLIFAGGKQRSPILVVKAAMFWASTSLLGLMVVVSAAMVLGYALGMFVVAVQRLFGNQVMLIDASGFQFMSFQAERWQFPPQTWSPALIALVGLLPALVIITGLYRFFVIWVRSRLAGRWLASVMAASPETLSRSWEHRAVLAMIATAGLGLGSCFFLSILSGMLPIGQTGSLSLPEDFFQSPLTVLAFVGMLVFLCSPVLGLLWSIRRART